MATDPQFRSDEEQEISRGGKTTAGWVLGLAVLVIGGGLALSIALRSQVSPPPRPGTTSATTTAEETKPPSP